jgi:cellulose synthase/poly-beta-1,6-N-acetylglucosamine synthase-like glycosyltransferase
MKGFEDWDFLIRLLKNAGKVYKSKSVLFYYRRHEKSLDKTYNRGDNRIKMIDYIFNKNKDIYEENEIKKERLLEPYINKNHKEIITNKMKKLALIVPTKDNVKQLTKFLYSIVYQTKYDKSNMTIYVVDNGSKDENKAKISELLGRIHTEHGYNVRFIEADELSMPKLYNEVVSKKVDKDTDLLLLCTDNVVL